MTDIRQIFTGTGCEIRADNLTRQLYATDASIYRIEPVAVAFPQTLAQASGVIRAAAGNGLSITFRGSGTGLAGGAIGEGLVVDIARHHKKILHIDAERRIARVEAGVVLDRLNEAAKPHGLWFGPDVATSSRATLGGMISNDSSGARAPLYGTTADHIQSLQLILADGRTLNTAAPPPEFCRPLDRLIRDFAPAIRERLPQRPVKHWPGYGIDRYLRRPDLHNIISGSEGTLAAVWEAEIDLSPLPREKGLAVIAFDSIMQAMQATVEILPLRPAAVEHIDRIVFDQTRGHPVFKPARDFLQLDERPCASILIVEFYDDVSPKLASLAAKKIGKRTVVCPGDKEMAMVWELRKAGLTILTGMPGKAKPVSGIEDVAVSPEHLPEYVGELQKLFAAAGTEASFYGHAASGLLHVRPVLDLKTEDGRKRLRHIAGEVSALVRQFRGSLAAEHGVGIARTEYLKEHLGAELMGLSRDIKNLFDPRQVLNPGKIVDTGKFKIDELCREKIELDFEPVLKFTSKDKSFLGNLEQCNGNGACLKVSPTMCPTYQATAEEIMSTRGRSNAIHSALGGHTRGDPLTSPEIKKALEYCLSCKACKTECPAGVDMALMKAELLYARHQKYGMPFSSWLLSRVDVLARVGSSCAPIANFLLTFAPFRALLEKTLGIARRPLPLYTRESFDRWYAKRGTAPQGPRRGRVILWDDTFVRYHEPNIGRAAVSVLEAAGYEVRLVTRRKCCGRPAFSMGDLKRAARLGRHNIERIRGNDPIVFLEPSCYSMFADDYRELNIPGAEETAARVYLFEDFIAQLLAKDPQALPFQNCNWDVAVHVHCHAKTCRPADVFKRVPGVRSIALNTGCCGMAGSFGMVKSRYELSLKIADPLARQIRGLPQGSRVVAAGISCRQQIAHVTDVRPLHAAELLAEALSGKVR